MVKNRRSQAERQAIERLCGRLASQGEISRNSRDKIKSTPVPESFINITEQRRLIRAAMDSIPHLQQRMIELAFFCGMSRHEIAMELGESPEAVEAGLRYAILQLFSVFKSMGFSPQSTTITHQDGSSFTSSSSPTEKRPPEHVTRFYTK